MLLSPLGCHLPSTHRHHTSTPTHVLRMSLRVTRHIFSRRHGLGSPKGARPAAPPRLTDAAARPHTSPDAAAQGTEVTVRCCNLCHGAGRHEGGWRCCVTHIVATSLAKTVDAVAVCCMACLRSRPGDIRRLLAHEVRHAARERACQDACSILPRDTVRLHSPHADSYRRQARRRPVGFEE